MNKFQAGYRLGYPIDKNKTAALSRAVAFDFRPGQAYSIARSGNTTR